MLDNSIQNATFVAYQEAGIEINIKDIKNIVIATTKENGIGGFEILEAGYKKYFEAQNVSG